MNWSKCIVCIFKLMSFCKSWQCKSNNEIFYLTRAAFDRIQRGHQNIYIGHRVHTHESYIGYVIKISFTSLRGWLGNKMLKRIIRPWIYLLDLYFAKVIMQKYFPRLWLFYRKYSLPYSSWTFKTSRQWPVKQYMSVRSLNGFHLCNYDNNGVITRNTFSL